MSVALFREWSKGAKGEKNMKGDFFILSVFIFIFGMIILEVIYKLYRRAKGKPVPYKRVKETYEPASSDLLTKPHYESLGTNIYHSPED